MSYSVTHAQGEKDNKRASPERNVVVVVVVNVRREFSLKRESTHTHTRTHNLQTSGRRSIGTVQWQMTPSHQSGHDDDDEAVTRRWVTKFVQLEEKLRENCNLSRQMFANVGLGGWVGLLIVVSISLQLLKALVSPRNVTFNVFMVRFLRKGCSYSKAYLFCFTI